MADLVYVPSKARRIILSWLTNKRLRDPAAMVLMALSEKVEQVFEDAALARIAGVDASELHEIIEKLAAAKWLRPARGPSAALYTLRDDGPLRPAWINASHMEPDDRC